MVDEGNDIVIFCYQKRILVMDIVLVSDILVVVVVVENGGFDWLKTAEYFLVELDVVGYVEDINI